VTLGYILGWFNPPSLSPHFRAWCGLIDDHENSHVEKPSRTQTETDAQIALRCPWERFRGPGRSKRIETPPLCDYPGAGFAQMTQANRTRSTRIAASRYVVEHYSSETILVHPGSLATPPQSVSPSAADFSSEAIQSVQSRGHSMVAEVPFHHAMQPSADMRRAASR
jgi:hypothetical protein